MLTQTLTDAATSKFVSIQMDGKSLNIYYNDTGNETPKSQTIVMLHGSGPGVTGWSNFGRSIGVFASAGYRVLIVTCPGWGKSDSIVSTGSRPELNARVLKGVLDAIGLEERVHIIGNSMGAHSAVAFALAHPDRVDKLVLIGGGTGRRQHFPAYAPRRHSPNARCLPRAIAGKPKKMLSVLVFKPESLSEEGVQALWNNVSARPDHLKNFIQSFGANPLQYPDVCSRLGEIAAPALLIWGRDDRFVPMDIGLRLVAGMQNANMHIIGGCGHGVLIEHLDKVNQMALDFFAN
ncbi:alpha/beta fold hydrolase [Polaromonas sp. P2-4]|nr:alpha/beta fold hydrolase [Polaromonas sp. P2-4]